MMDNTQSVDPSNELSTTKAILEITRNKLFTAISTITELELIIAIERDKNKALKELLESYKNKNTGI